MSRAVQGPGIKPSDWGALFKKNFQVLVRGLFYLELSFAREGESFGPREGRPPKGVLPDRAGSRASLLQEGRVGLWWVETRPLRGERASLASPLARSRRPA